MHKIDLDIKEAIELGNLLMCSKTLDNKFAEYELLTKRIIQQVNKTTSDSIKIRTSELILNLNLREFDLNFFQKIIYPFHQTGEFLWPTNSSFQIRKRYIMAINSRLPILNSN
jgi:hypothetical protein